ncbi:MAG: plasmid pRiA4b ORF-3 family protein [Actinophytocola sp.]|uniref:plasmid pRiA4b ORF-3 family protein n=1 Tax=Actinophytocola sp. TaxID=1872138 RepID=UPI003C71278E
MESELVEQVRAFVRGVGTGRKLTQTGRITLTDARALVESLGTGDVLDPAIGDRVYRTNSSQELHNLTLLVEWAKAARLVRRTGNRLVAVKKNAALLDDQRALWLTLFTTFDRMGEAFLPAGPGESPLRTEFVSGTRAMLTLLYQDGQPVDRLCAMVWDVVTAPYVLDDATEFQLGLWRQCNDRDVRFVLDVLRRLGAVTIEDETVAMTALGLSGMRTLLDEPDAGEPVYQLKITLVDADEPPVWRRVLVPAAIRLDRLHGVIQAVMGWQNAHMHVFSDGQTQYGVPDPELEYHDEHATKLNELVSPGGRIEYTYDLGDTWDHEILVEEVTVTEDGQRCPWCVAGQGACPPEDSGGVGGYQQLVEILADPGHEEHQSMLDWLGLDSRDQFDPARFDPDDANRRLAVSSQAGFITVGR